MAASTDEEKLAAAEKPVRQLKQAGYVSGRPPSLFVIRLTTTHDEIVPYYLQYAYYRYQGTITRCIQETTPISRLRNKTEAE